MKPLTRILTLLSAVLILVGSVSCSDSRGDAPEAPATTMLTIRVKLSRDTYGAPSRATGDEYEPYKLPADDGEKMHSLRIIILDGNMQVEHNSYWDLNSPDTEAAGARFKVKSDDHKTIILVANEAGAIVTDRNGNSLPAADYFRKFDPSVGALVDLNELRALTMRLDDNIGEPGQLRTPLVINDIHYYYIGKSPEYSHTFYVGRAAVKHTFRITNNDKSEAHTLTSLTIGRVATEQYFFQNAVFTDNDHFLWSSYKTPAGAGARDLTLDINRSIPAGGTVEIGPVYIPEGAVYDTPYQIGLAVDGNNLGRYDIAWHMPQTPDVSETMTDLPRNTHIITEITLNYTDLSLQYTVCPWDDYKVYIPSFN